MEDTFVWTDELIIEFANNLYIDTMATKNDLEVFKKSKQSKLDYEIMSYSYRNKIYRLNVLGEFVCGLDVPIHELILHPENMTKIYSVKRLSDNEVFTIGETIHTGNAEITKIISFKILEGNYMSVEIESGYYRLLSNIEHKGKGTPLFTTEDNKPIYEGDKYWAMDNKFNYWYSGSAGHGSGTDRSRKYFSSQEECVEYTQMNKPCLSLKEIIDNFYTYGGVPKGSEQYNNILQLAKQKTKSL